MKHLRGDLSKADSRGLDTETLLLSLHALTAPQVRLSPINDREEITFLNGAQRYVNFQRDERADTHGAQTLLLNLHEAESDYTGKRRHTGQST